MSLCIVESGLSSPEGTTWGNLRDKMPGMARAETKVKAKIVCELIYKRRATLKGKLSPQNWARTPGTPLPGLSLTHSSLLHRLLCVSEGVLSCVDVHAPFLYAIRYSH